MKPMNIAGILFISIMCLWGCEGQQGNAQLPATDSLNVETAGINPAPHPVFQEVITPQVEVDLQHIKERGRLIALTGYSSNSYFVYKGETLGFEYELLKMLADDLGVELEIVIVRDLDQIFSMLNEGKGDLIAYSMTITKKRLKKVDFSRPHSLIHQVLVQKMPNNWRDLKRHEIDKQLIMNPVNLIDKKVHVRKGSSYYARLVNLSDEIGGDIDIVEVPGNVSTEELIAKVSRGEIDYTVADENFALINAAYLQNIDIRTAISFPQRIAWPIRSNSPELKLAIDKWLRKIKSEPTYNVLFDKYYQNKRFFKQRVKSDYYSVTGGKISPYDDMIKEQANFLEWDWRLLASQIYQESQFDPKAKSWAGARGLMQLMPRTARSLGVTKVHDPQQNLVGGAKYLQWLEKYWADIPDSTERIKFILGSYNAGQGHVEDARRLAKKNQKDPNIWDGHVAEWLLKKSKKQYFNDDVVEHGYCRGQEPVEYVIEIFDRYSEYQQFAAR